MKDILLSYDRTLLVADPRRCEPKKCALLIHVIKGEWKLPLKEAQSSI